MTHEMELCSISSLVPTINVILDYFLAAELEAVCLSTVNFVEIGCGIFLGETENGFVISDHMDSLPPPKKYRKKQKSFAMTTRD